MKTILILVFFATSAFAGIVDVTRCGGAGTIILDIANCHSGVECRFDPGTPISIGVEIIPSLPSKYLNLKITGNYLGFPIVILEVVVQKQSEGDQYYVIKYAFTANDLLSGNTLPITVEVFQIEPPMVEACVKTNLVIN